MGNFLTINSNMLSSSISFSQTLEKVGELFVVLTSNLKNYVYIKDGFQGFDVGLGKVRPSF